MSGRRSGVLAPKKPVGPSDFPACLAIGTDVSAKFKGAFCEAVIQNFEKKLIEIKAQPLKDESIPADHVYTHEDVQGKLEMGSNVQVSYKQMFVEARITHIRDLSQYKIVFNDGDERIVKRNQMLLKGEKHYDSQSNLDNLPLLNPDALKSSVEETFIGASRSATRQLKAIMDVGQQRERQSEKLSAWSSLSDLSESSDEEAPKVDDEGPSKKTKKGDLDQGKKKGKAGRSSSPKNDFAEGKAVIGRAKTSDSSKTNLCFGVVVSRSAFLGATTERNKAMADNEVPVKCLPKGEYRIFKTSQLALYDENKLSLDSLSSKLRESCEVLLRYKNKGRLPAGWTDESIHGAQQTPTKKSRKSKRHNAKNNPRRDKFYRHLNAYYKDIIDMNISKLNPTTKGGVELDMCRLFFTVRQEGGYRAVSFSDKWTKIAQKLKWTDYLSGDELRDLYHNRLETFEYFHDRMADSKLAKPDTPKATTKGARQSHASTPTPSIADRAVRTTPKKSQTPAAVEKLKRKAPQPTPVVKKHRRGSASSVDSIEGSKMGTASSRKGSSSSPHPSQKVRVMSPTELDANDGYVAADIFSQIVETKIIRAAHRTKFYSARVVDARRAPIEVILRVLTKLEPVVGTSNNYKFQNKLHRDALIELGRLTSAFVHYCGWNNRFDEWVSIDRIKVSPETKRLSMLNLIRAYSFSPNLLDAIHSFFKRRRITREKYKARRHAVNSDDAADDEESKKLGGVGGKKKEGSQLDGPPAQITLYPELQKFLYDDENFKIPEALPEKIEKDEYDEIPNSELAAVNAMLSDAEANEDDEIEGTPTTSKRPLKRKKTKPTKEEEKKEVQQKSTPAKEKPVVEPKKEPEEVVEKKKKLTEEKSTAKKAIETPKQQPKQKEEPKQQKSTAKESPTKTTTVIQKEKKEEKPKEKPTTRSATPIKKQKIDPNVNRPLDFMSGITTTEEKRGKSPTKGVKAQKSEDALPSVEASISVAIPPQPFSIAKSKTPATQPEAVQTPTDLPSPTPQRQTPSRRGAKTAERQPSVSSTTPSSPKPTTQPQEVPKEEPAVVSPNFKAFSPITPPSATTAEPTIDVTDTISDAIIVTQENQFSPKSRFLQTLAQQPHPVWRAPNQNQSDADLTAEFEVHESRNQITLDTLRHIPPALLASHLNIPLSSAALFNAEQMKPISGTPTAVKPTAISSAQQGFAAKNIAQPHLTSTSSTPQQVFSPQTSLIAVKPPNQQLTQQSMAAFNSIQSAVGSQIPLNPQLLALLQTLQQQQNVIQQVQLAQQQKPSQFSSPIHFQQPHLITSQVGTSASTGQQQVHDIKPQMSTAALQSHLQQTNLLGPTKLAANSELDQTPAMKCVTEYVLLLQYLCIDPATQETLETLRRSFSMSRYDGLRLIRPQYTNVIARIAELDQKCNSYMDPVMRPLIESFVSTKISTAIRAPGGLAPMLQQFVHPVIYNQMVALPQPSQVAPLSLPQLQLLLGQRQQPQQPTFRQTTLPTPNFLNEQLLAQQRAQLAQHNTGDQIHARLQALLMSMQNGVQPVTSERAYISPPNDPRPSISANVGQSVQQTSTNSSSSGAFTQCIKPEPLIRLPGIYSTDNSTSKWSVSNHLQKHGVQVQAESVQMLGANAQATLNVSIGKTDQQAGCNYVWPIQQTTCVVAAVDQKPCEDCGANPRVVEMHLLNKLPIHLRTQILDNYAKAHKMSKERRNRPQCKVKNLTKQAQKQKIERRRKEQMLEERRNGNGSDFMLIDQRFCNNHAPVEPPLLSDIFSSLGYDIFATDRLPESEEIKQKCEASVKELGPEQVRESVLKLLKENGAEQSNIDFDRLEDLNRYIQTLSNLAEQHQVRLGLANHNLEMTDEISKTVVDVQKTIAEEQQKYETHEETTLANAAVVNKNKPKYLLHRGRKGYY